MFQKIKTVFASVLNALASFKEKRTQRNHQYRAPRDDGDVKGERERGDGFPDQYAAKCIDTIR